MKSLLFRLTLPLFLILVPSCGPEPDPAVPVPGHELDWEAIALKIVVQADLQSGETVLQAIKADQFGPLVPHLGEQIKKAGAIDLGTHDVASGELSDEQYRQILESVDLMIILPGPMPTDGLYRVMQEILSEGTKRTIHFHWEGAVPLPGHKPPSPKTVDKVHQNALLSADYGGIAETQLKFEAALRSGETRVTTPLGTDLSFRIGDRPVTRQDGDASLERSKLARVLIDREVELPCGAIRVAPLEESVTGVVVFPAAQWNGQNTSAVALRFEEGKVVKVEPKGPEADAEAVEAEMVAGGEAARSFREFALGFNPLLAIQEQDPWIPYYGYGAGVVRLSLGDNSELGGQVRGPYVRWNFFVDATVTVDGEVWVENGRLVK